MLEWVMGRRTSAKKPLKAGQKKKPSYEESKKIAAKGDSKARAALAAHEDLEPEFLYLFASDKDATAPSPKTKARPCKPTCCWRETSIRVCAKNWLIKSVVWCRP